MTKPANETFASFDDVYRAYAGMARRTLFKLMGDRDLDDAVQEAFVRIWKGLDRFDGRSTLRTWIYSITVNTGIDFIRKRRPIFPLPAELPAPGHPSQAYLIRDLIHKALMTLSIEHRAAVVLQVYEGLSMEEISQITNTEVGTVKSRLHYAKSEMKRFLEKQGVNV